MIAADIEIWGLRGGPTIVKLARDTASNRPWRLTLRYLSYGGMPHRSKASARILIVRLFFARHAQEDGSLREDTASPVAGRVAMADGPHLLMSWRS